MDNNSSNLLQTEDGQLLWYNPTLETYHVVTLLNKNVAGDGDGDAGTVEGAGYSEEEGAGSRAPSQGRLAGNGGANSGKPKNTAPVEGEGAVDEKIWNNSNTLFLIKTVKDLDKEFSSGIKKNVWAEVAKRCAHLHKGVNAKQCETKWKTLKRTYKTVLINNNTSGQKRRVWEYFDKMHEFLYKKPEINPVATCSSKDGLKTSNGSYGLVTSKETVEDKDSELETSIEDPVDHKNKTSSSTFESSFQRKRKQRLGDIERRHREKMERMDRFNDSFDKLLDKIYPDHVQAPEPETDDE